jgi:hypothetical protein
MKVILFKTNGRFIWIVSCNTLYLQYEKNRKIGLIIAVIGMCSGLITQTFDDFIYIKSSMWVTAIGILIYAIAAIIDY